MHHDESVKSEADIERILKEENLDTSTDKSDTGSPNSKHIKNETDQESGSSNQE